MPFSTPPLLLKSSLCTLALPAGSVSRTLTSHALNVNPGLSLLSIIFIGTVVLQNTPVTAFQPFPQLTDQSLSSSGISNAPSSLSQLAPAQPRRQLKLGAFWKNYLVGDKTPQKPAKREKPAPEIVTLGVIQGLKDAGTTVLPSPIQVRSRRVLQLIPGKKIAQRGILSGLLSGAQELKPTRGFCRGATCPTFRMCRGELDSIRSCVNEGLASAEAHDIRVQCPQDSGMLEYFSTLPSDCKRRKDEEARGHKPEDEPIGSWEGQVVRLHHVYLDSFGHVFNATHRFDFGGCSDPTRDRTALTYRKGAKVRVYEKLVNLMLEPQEGMPGLDLEYEELAMKLPLFMSLAPLMRKFRNLPWAIQNRKVIHFPWKTVLGQALAPYPLHPISFPTVIFARRLYVPLMPPCGRPSASQWQAFRSRHLLPISGLPMFNADGSVREGGVDIVDPVSGHPSVSHDWVVVVSHAGVRRQHAHQMSAVQGVIEDMFSIERVIEYDGRVSLAQAKEMFGRALLFVAPSGPSLVNMVFLPFNASVLEVRLPPDPEIQGHRTPEETAALEDLYEKLATACGLVHFALDCDGGDGEGGGKRGEDEACSAAEAEREPRCFHEWLECIAGPQQHRREREA